MVEVFKTNVQHEHDAVVILEQLSRRYPMHRINFDLDDCDKILRLEGTAVCPETVTDLLRCQGHHCEVLQ